MASVVFFGTPEFAMPVLEALLAHHQVLAVVTQPDRYAGRGRRTLVQPPVKELAAAHGVPVLQPTRLRGDRETLATLAGLGADVYVLAAYGQILRENLLRIPPFGVIGVHASLLPSYRGAAPIAAAIRDGQERTGITLMLTDAGMDTGDVLAQRSLAIAPDDTTETLSDRLAHLGAELLIEVLPLWLRGELEAQPQDDSLATAAPPLSKQEGHIDWHKSALEIDRLVRAMTPWPGSYALLDGLSLKILKARPSACESRERAPGTLVACSEGLGVATGAGILVLDVVQPSGKRPMVASEFARGRRDLIGTVLT